MLTKIYDTVNCTGDVLAVQQSDNIHRNIFTYVPESVGGVSGSITVALNDQSLASIAAVLNVSQVNWTSLSDYDANCSGPVTEFAWYLHNKLNSTNRSAFSSGCSFTHAGYHYDPDFACGPNSDKIETTQCHTKVNVPGFHYDCSPSHSQGCEMGDLSGRLGYLQLTTDSTTMIHQSWTNVSFPNLYESPSSWSIMIHAVCNEQAVPRLTCASAEVLSASCDRGMQYATSATNEEFAQDQLYMSEELLTIADQICIIDPMNKSLYVRANCTDHTLAKYSDATCTSTPVEVTQHVTPCNILRPQTVQKSMSYFAVYNNSTTCSGPLLYLWSGLSTEAPTNCNAAIGSERIQTDTRTENETLLFEFAPGKTYMTLFFRDDNASAIVLDQACIALNSSIFILVNCTAFTASYFSDRKCLEVEKNANFSFGGVFNYTCSAWKGNTLSISSASSFDIATTITFPPTTDPTRTMISTTTPFSSPLSRSTLPPTKVPRADKKETIPESSMSEFFMLFVLLGGVAGTAFLFWGKRQRRFQYHAINRQALYD
jgi:hypothetical protein